MDWKQGEWKQIYDAVDVVNTNNTNRKGLDINVISVMASLHRKQTQHEGVKYSCDKCDVILSDKSSFYKHKKFNHEEGGYECSICDKVLLIINVSDHMCSKFERPWL